MTRRHCAFSKDAERGDGAGVPERLVLVAGVTPVDEGLRIGQLDGLGVVLHHQQLGAVSLRGAWRACRYHKQQVTHGRVVGGLADELAHDPQASTAGDGAVVGDQVPGDFPSIAWSCRCRSARSARSWRPPRPAARPRAARVAVGARRTPRRCRRVPRSAVKVSFRPRHRRGMRGQPSARYRGSGQVVRPSDQRMLVILPRFVTTPPTPHGGAHGLEVVGPRFPRRHDATEPSGARGADVQIPPPLCTSKCRAPLAWAVHRLLPWRMPGSRGGRALGGPSSRPERHLPRRRNDVPPSPHLDHPGPGRCHHGDDGPDRPSYTRNPMYLGLTVAYAGGAWFWAPGGRRSRCRRSWRSSTAT